MAVENRYLGERVMLSPSGAASALQRLADRVGENGVVTFTVHRNAKRPVVVPFLDGELTLGESPFDPVADLPVRRLARLEYEEGNTESNGRVLRPVTGAWLLPFLHQRYDDPAAKGVEV